MFIKIKTVETAFGGRLPDADGYINTDLVTHWLADEVSGQPVSHVYFGNGGRVIALIAADELAGIISHRT